MADARWRVVAVADFDADSRPDLLWRHTATGELYVWLLEGTSVKAGVRLTPDRLSSSDWVLAQTADFDRDGEADLLWHNRRTGDFFVWFLSGTVVDRGSFLTPSHFSDPRWFVVPR